MEAASRDVSLTIPAKPDYLTLARRTIIDATVDESDLEPGRTVLVKPV